MAAGMFTLDLVKLYFVQFAKKIIYFLFKLIKSRSRIDFIAINVLAFATNSVTMYLITSFATEIELNFIRIGDNIYFEEWYHYSKSLKIYVLLILQSTQRPHHLSGFQIIYCNLETFVNVSAYLQK